MKHMNPLPPCATCAFRPGRILLLVAVLVMSVEFAGAQVPDLYDPDAYRTIHLQFSQPNWWYLLEQNYSSETEIPADMTVDNIKYPNVGVRFRGNTSYTQLPRNCEKKSFNIRLDSFVPSQDIYGYDHLNLNNGFHDPTFIREFLAYWVCRRHGPALKANFVKLYLNNQYWGVYINVQQPNKDWAKEWFRSNDGNRYRGFPERGMFQNGRCAFTWLGSNVQAYLDAYQAKQGDGTDLMQFCNVLNNTPSNQLQAALPALFNVDQFYRYAACMNIITQEDSYIGSGKDHFLYGDEIHGDFYTFAFDLNESFTGKYSMNPWFNITKTDRPALSRTLVFPDWRERYDAHYRNILEDTFNWQVLGPVVTKYHAMIATDVAADTKKIYTTQAFQDNLTRTVSVTVGPWRVNIPGLQPLIQQREAYLKGNAEFNRTRVALTNLQRNPASPGSKDTVTVTVQATANAVNVELWSRVTGPFQKTRMYDDGLHGDGKPGDGVWGGTISAQPSGSIVEYYTLAATASGDMVFLPRNGDFGAASYLISWPQGSSPIRINEFVARNVNGIVDEKLQHEDWLELYNDSTATVDVGGMYLTDDLSKTKWQIPAKTMISPRGTLFVWCDEDGTQGPMHANFKLSAAGEEIGLFSTDGKTLLDSVRFGIQEADVATGRLSDGKDGWVTFPEPTPDQPNELGTCGLRLFSALLPGNHRLSLDLDAKPALATTPNLDAAGGQANSAFCLAFSSGGASIPILEPVTLLLDPIGFLGSFLFTFDAQGRFTAPFSIPNDLGLIGSSLYLQGFTVDSQGLTATNGLEIKFCP